MAADRRISPQRGFTLLALLALLAVLSLGLAAAGPTWSHGVQREREQELLRIGALYVQALESYREASPGGAKVYPTDLQALLLDTRHVGVKRHLRRLFPDPIGAGTPWGIVRSPDGKVIGVFSQSTARPLGRGPAGVGGAEAGAVAYADWKFMVQAER